MREKNRWYWIGRKRRLQPFRRVVNKKPEAWKWRFFQDRLSNSFRNVDSNSYFHYIVDITGIRHKVRLSHKQSWSFLPDIWFIALIPSNQRDFWPPCKTMNDWYFVVAFKRHKACMGLFPSRNNLSIDDPVVVKWRRIKMTRNHIWY
jgi:hypothetical protein